MKAMYAMEAYGPYGTVSLVDPLQRGASGYVEVKRIKYKDGILKPGSETHMRVYFRVDNIGPLPEPSRKALHEDILALVEEAVGPLSDHRDTSRRVEIGEICFYANNRAN